MSPIQVQHWIKTYKVRFEKLKKEGRITDADRECVLVVKRCGLWNFINDVDALIKPAEFIKYLKKTNQLTIVLMRLEI